MDFLVGFLLLALDFRAFGFNYPEFVKQNAYQVEMVNYNSGSGKCPKIKQPLCGTNGKEFLYFENKCEFEVKNYELLVQGLMEYYECPLSFCKSGCPKCDAVNEPVCAINILTGEIEDFPNHCEVQRKTCTTQQDWQIVDSYECNSIKQNSIGSPMIPLSQYSECPEYCTLEYQPICARYMTLEKEFANECELKTTICQTKQKWDIVRRGPCQSYNYNTAAPSSPIFVKLQNGNSHLIKDDVSFKSESNINAKLDLLTPKLKCSQICTLEYGPVCAKFNNNVKEFSNNCQLEKTICETNEKWEIVNLGICSSVSTTSPSLESACPKICNRKYKPVCAKFANEFREFSNKCVFENWNCKSDDKWEIVNLGPCSTATKNLLSSHLKCPKFCIPDYSPVCAKFENELREFRNKCELQRTNCASEKTWTVVKLGRCSPKSSHTSLPPSNTCPEFCANEYRPVCAKFGSKLREFSNKCELQKTACETNTDWQLFKKGRCPLVSESKSPCPSLCTKEFSPVCARCNGELREFFNSCEFQKQACETNKDWELFNNGPCFVNQFKRLGSSCENETIDPICATHETETKTFNNTCQLAQEIKSTGIYWSILHEGICSPATTTSSSNNTLIGVPFTLKTTSTSYTTVDQARTTSQSRNTTFKTTPQPRYSTTPTTTKNTTEPSATNTPKTTKKTKSTTQKLKSITTDTRTTTAVPKTTTTVNINYYSVISSTITSNENSSEEVTEGIEDNSKEHNKQNDNNNSLSSCEASGSSSSSDCKNNTKYASHTLETTSTTPAIPETTTTVRPLTVPSNVNSSEKIKEYIEENYKDDIKENASYSGLNSYEDSTSSSGSVSANNSEYVTHKQKTTTRSITVGIPKTTSTTPAIPKTTTTNHYPLKLLTVPSDENSLEEFKEDIDEHFEEYNKENINYTSSSSKKLKTSTTAASITVAIPKTTTTEYYSQEPSTVTTQENRLEEVIGETEVNSKQCNKENSSCDVSSRYEGNSSTSKSKYSIQNLKSTSPVTSTMASIAKTTTVVYTKHYAVKPSTTASNGNSSAEVSEILEGTSKEYNKENANYSGSSSNSSEKSSAYSYEGYPNENDASDVTYRLRDHDSDSTNNLIYGEDSKDAERSKEREVYQNVASESPHQNIYSANSEVSQDLASEYKTKLKDSKPTSDKYFQERFLNKSKSVINNLNLLRPEKSGKTFQKNYNKNVSSSTETLNRATEYFEELVQLIEKQIMDLLSEAKYADSSEESSSDEIDFYTAQNSYISPSPKQLNESSKTYTDENLHESTSYEEYQTQNPDYSQDSDQLTYSYNPTSVKENAAKYSKDAYGDQKLMELNQYNNENMNNKYKVSDKLSPVYQNNSDYHEYAPVPSIQNKNNFTHKTESDLKAYETILIKSGDGEEASETLLSQLESEITTRHLKYEETTEQLSPNEFERRHSKNNSTNTKKGEIYNAAVYKAPVYDAPTYNFIYTAPNHAILPVYYPGHGPNYANRAANHNTGKPFVPILNNTNAEMTANIPLGPLQFLSSWAAKSSGFTKPNLMPVPAAMDSTNNIPASKQRLYNTKNNPLASENNQSNMTTLKHGSQPLVNKSLPQTYTTPRTFPHLPSEQFISSLTNWNINFAHQTPKHNKEFENNQKPKMYHIINPPISEVKAPTLSIPQSNQIQPVFLPKPSVAQPSIPSQAAHSPVPFAPVPLNTVNYPPISYNSTLLNQILETLKTITNRH